MVELDCGMLDLSYPACGLPETLPPWHMGIFRQPQHAAFSHVTERKLRNLTRH